MLARNVFEPKTLEEIGWISLVYSYLDETVSTFLEAIKEPDKSPPDRTSVAAQGLKSKLKDLHAAAHGLGRIYGLNTDHLDEMLPYVYQALEQRNELVHGFISFADDGKTPIARRIHKLTRGHPVSWEEVQRTSHALWEALVKVLNFGGMFWNALVKARRKSAEAEQI